MLRLLTATILAVASLTAVARDPHSHANLDQVRMTALHLDLAVDFEAKTLEGFADLDLAWDDPDARQIVLDTRDLRIDRVEGRSADGTWRTLSHALGARDALLGQPLRIEARQQPTRIRIHYATDPTASGLQWLSPRQTMSGRHPFLFSQSQAIHARSWVPLQDSPAVRFPYRARVTAPESLRVLMSAENPEGPQSGAWYFRMSQPIPSYLLAIAVGEIDAREIGPRVTIYAEPQRLDAAAAEFADTERMIDVTESLYGPYRWGRYDLLILPPSFPYGGMENPRLSFITPTVIAGDRSLVSLIAHELAHSWSGNLVTNATWADFWLNEGFTTYVENRIVEALFGTDAAIMQQQVGQTELIEEMQGLAPYLQSLLPQRQGLDPDATFSSVPYDKGAWFLRTLEQRVGREVFDPFLRGWFDGHAFESVGTDTFLAHLRGHLLVEHPEAIDDEELAEWLSRPGIPASAVAARSGRLAAVDDARRRFLAGEVAPDAMKDGDWNTQEWLHFLNGLPQTTTIAQLAALDQEFSLSKAGNSEIAFRWFMAGIRAGYEPVFEPLERFLVTVGRRKFVKPLFEALWAVPARREFATRVYTEARPRYHPVTQAAVDAIVGRDAA
jgi:aminopeptidase N